MNIIRILTFALTIPLLVWIALSRLFNRISHNIARNRLGFATASRPTGKILWLHAASLGELSSVRPFLVYLTENHPDLRLLITTNNPNAIAIAHTWPEVTAVFQAAPLDIPFVVSRFLSHWRPVAFVNVETELWPNRFAALKKRAIPAIALNARLSRTSARRMQFLGVKNFNLDVFAHFFVQDAGSAAALQKIDINADQIDVIPNIKSAVSLPNPDAKTKQLFDRSTTILAASTHIGEDILILRAFQDLFTENQSLRLIIAPRHPARASSINKLANECSFQTTFLSNANKAAPVTIVDTLGELPKLYALASVTLVGGSLVPGIGGHTPYEPIRAGSAVVTGPFTNNFACEYLRISTENAGLVSDTDLASTLKTALQNAPFFAQNANRVFPAVKFEPIFAKALLALGKMS